MLQLEWDLPIFQTLNPRPHNPQHTHINPGKTNHKHFISTKQKHPIHKQSEKLTTYPNQKRTPTVQQDLSCWKIDRLNLWNNIIIKQYPMNQNRNSPQTTSQSQSEQLTTNNQPTSNHDS